jgi:hypothetical protein
MTGFAPQPRPTLSVLAADLAAGRTTSSTLVDEALARIANPTGEGRRTFVKVYADAARAAAEAQDRLRAAGYVASPLAGLPVTSSTSPASARSPDRGHSTTHPRPLPMRRSWRASKRQVRSSSGAPT